LTTKTRVASGYWNDRSNRRHYLCEIAKLLGNDPLIAEDWEKLSSPIIEKHVGRMATQFNGSYKLVLVDAFPELCFSKTWLKGVHTLS